MAGVWNNLCKWLQGNGLTPETSTGDKEKEYRVEGVVKGDKSVLLRMPLLGGGTKDIHFKPKDLIFVPVDMKQESLKAATDKAMIKLEVTVEHETLTLEDVERIVAIDLNVDVAMLRSRRGLVKEFIYNYYDKLQQDENRRQKEYLKLELRKMCREGNVSGLLDTLNVASRFVQETGVAHFLMGFDNMSTRLWAQLNLFETAAVPKLL